MSELGSRNSPRSGLARGMDAHALARAPVPGVYLLYDFHTAAEESYLLSRVDNEPKTRWTTVSDRRVLQFGALLCRAEATAAKREHAHLEHAEHMPMLTAPKRVLFLRKRRRAAFA